MPHAVDIAIVVGGVAYLGLALVRLLGLHALVSRPDKVPMRVGMSRSSAALMIYRQIFVFLAFGAISLLHAGELATTALGFTTVLIMALFLLLKAGEHIYVPEIRQERLHFEFALALIGGASYLWAVTSGI